MKSRMADYPTSLSAPIDQVAKRVTSKGFQHEFSRKEGGEIVSDVPLPTIPWPKDVQNRIGEQHDRLTIVGFISKRAKENKPHKMLARCRCGNFCIRNTTTWGKSKPPYDDACLRCKTMQQRIRHDVRRRYFEQHGVPMPTKGLSPKD